MILTLRILCTLGTTAAVLVVVLFMYFTFYYKEPTYLADHSAHIADAAVQPNQAIEIAKPYLPGHGTVRYRKDKPLTVHLLRLGEWYYVMQTNYPAKTIRFYMQPAVKVHVHTGQIEFSTR